VISQELFKTRVAVRAILNPELEKTRSSTLKEQLDYWTGKAAKMLLTGEHKTYEWEYNTCLERKALFQRLLDKREARLRSSSTKPLP
jgi:hypothetical protein